ncbi:diguanylate cyclase (GGDEF)-like protein [Roseinatronobacter thiooxidans]|uniref:Diguanylate cyclase (GGDEF)-like protein n=1 Tax=Roseinatronobacter thiooxidans TaxID=121821 RepID=A0A2W7PL05_9RHOB|nr:sensor domain-containing phosphodiesterase [Roseinatronobacter thiooxidans]PZX36206.1 diguanylate cyclase (GGDEF)-like protein [Roseinatronobacter thiooxidans]
MADATVEGFTLLATKILKVPIAHIGLPSGDKNWVKSGVGIDTNACSRAESFCGHAIHESNMMVVPDTLHDPRFTNHPMVTETSNIRFYAGAVIRGRNQEAIGTLCVIDTKPRVFSDQERETLGHLRDIVQERILDYGERQIRHNEIVQEARTDKVTTLLNRLGLKERLDQTVQWASTGRDLVFGVLMLEIVAFNNIKRGHGLAISEGVLTIAKRRIVETLSDGYIHGRWREGIFVTIAPNATSDDELVDAAAQLVEAFRKPVLDSVMLHVRIGISKYPTDGGNSQSLIDAAEQAIENVSAHNKSGFALANHELNAAFVERLDLENRLRRAIHRGELSVVYQPKINLGRGQISEAEALVRWNDPDIGMIPPSRFIAIAENAGLIGLLGAYILTTACQEAVSWGHDTRGASTVAVNVSAIQLQDPGFPDTVRKALADTGLSPENLILEVTESAVMDDTDIVLPNMRAIATMGVRFAIDDFGTGYSNFDNLRRLPIHSLKIDKRFVDQITENQNDARICQAMIALGRALNLVVVAEGVETHEQSLFLKAYGCDQLQGFYFSRPLNRVEFREFVEARNSQHQ